MYASKRAHFVYPKSVPSFDDNSKIRFKVERSGCTLFFAHFVHPKSVPSFTSECEQLQNYFERLAHFTVPTMYAFFLTIPFRKSTLARNFQKVERKLLNFLELSFKVLKP